MNAGIVNPWNNSFTINGLQGGCSQYIDLYIFLSFWVRHGDATIGVRFAFQLLLATKGNLSGSRMDARERSMSSSGQ
jgi:hypothetical protein